jgi:signal transduction histidine kinase
MERLIDEVLTLARQGKDVEEFERLELEETVQLAWSSVDEMWAELEYEDLPAITADGERLRRLFENLFRNALEHGGEDVTVRVGTLGEDGFFVEDDGPGIPKHERDEIFDPGYTTGEDGTGLGLAIVQSIAEAHGWEIDVAEGTDGGARFEIRGVQVLADVEQ